MSPARGPGSLPAAGRAGSGLLLPSQVRRPGRCGLAV